MGKPDIQPDIHFGGLGIGAIVRVELARFGRFLAISRTSARRRLEVNASGHLRTAGVVTLFAYLFTVTAAGQATAQETDASTTEIVVTVTFQVALSEEAYNAWDGSLDDPRFLFPGATKAIRPRVKSPVEFLSKVLSGAEVREQDPGFTAYAVVGRARCTIRAHNPHAGDGPGLRISTKAKANGSCQLIPTGEGPLPPEDEMWWLALLTLKQHSNPVGLAYYFRSGHRVRWTQNPSQGYPGTQVFRNNYACVNGLHEHVAEVYVLAPGPFTYVGPDPIEDDQQSAIVSGCVQEGTE